MPTDEKDPTPETRLADRLRALAKLLDTPHDTEGGCRSCPRCRARIWSERGYPAATLGDGTGSRSSDTTSSTERAGLRLDPLVDLIGGTRAWDQLVADTTDHAWRLANLAHLLLASATNTDDRVAVGRGNCRRCETFCIGDGGNNRLRGGLCHPCNEAFRRWRAANPGANQADYIRANPAPRHTHRGRVTA